MGGDFSDILVSFQTSFYEIMWKFCETNENYQMVSDFFFIILFLIMATKLLLPSSSVKWST